MPRIVSCEDVALLAQLRRAWTEENAGAAIDDAGFETRFAAWWEDERDRRCTWIALVDDRPVGMLNMAEFVRMPRPGSGTGRWGYVANVFVLAAHRNAGIGRRLLDVAVGEARRRGYVRVVLSPSQRSVPLYRRVGFREADELLVLAL